MPRKSSKPANRSRSRSKQALPDWAGWAFAAFLILMVAVVVYMNTSKPRVTNNLPDQVPPEQAYSMILAGAVVIDIRPAGEFAAFQIPGSLSVPLDRLEQSVAGIPRGVNLIVVDFMGADAPRARDILLENGFNAVTAMQSGIEEWRLLGLPLLGTFPE